MDDIRDNSPTAEARPGGAERALRSGPPLTVLGDFELQHELGRGGMGTVYKAWQRSLQRSVAVKVLNQQVSASPTAVIRFQREAQAAANLHHPHIVPIFALGEKDGLYYYAMEYVDGCGLHSLIAKGRDDQVADTASNSLADTVPLGDVRRSGAAARPDSGGPTAGGSGVRQSGGDGIRRVRAELRLSDEEFAFIAGHIADVADALAYAHDQGVVHRDIKPHNLLLGRDNKLRISDFGLARLAAQPGVTITGELIGSPLYMSPEQITGDASKLDHRTDIYSLGATLYEWLTLEPPYPGETREQVISRLLTSEPIALRTHNPHIPLDLETICLTAIERDRSRRYSTAAELRDDLRRFLAKRPIRARRAGMALRARKFVGRHQLATLAVLAIVVASLLSSALFSKQRQVRTQTQVAERARQDTATLRSALNAVMNRLPPELSLPLLGAERARPMIEEVVGEGALAVTGLAGSELQGPNPTEAGRPLGIARRAARDLHDALVPEGWPSNVPGGTDRASGLLVRALGMWETQPDVAAELIGVYLEEHPDHFEAREYCTALHGRQGRFDEMLRDAEELVRLRPSDGRAYVWRALANLCLDHPTAAMSDIEQGRINSGPRAWVHALRGLALSMLTREVEAISAFDEALAVKADFVVALLARADARTALGNDGGAVADLSRVVALEPENVSAYVLRGDRYIELFDYGAAEQDYAKALELGGQSWVIAVRYALAQSKLQAPEHDGSANADSEPGGETGVEEPGGDPREGARRESMEAWIGRILQGKRRDDESASPAAPRPPVRPSPVRGSWSG